jgi:hypothetical protein
MILYKKMSSLIKDNKLFSNNENSQDDISLDNQINTKVKNIKIYDDDNAYMLNFDKDNTDDIDARGDVSDLDNYEKIKEKNNKNKSKMNFSDEIDDHEPRKEFNSAKFNTDNNEKNRKDYNNNISENIKKGKK